MYYIKMKKQLGTDNSQMTVIWYNGNLSGCYFNGFTHDLRVSHHYERINRY